MHAVIITFALCATSALSAQTPGPPKDTTKATSIEAVKVTSRIDDLTGVAVSASEGRVGARDLQTRPLTREGELLESVPGVIVTQHSGDGKANQYFVRGFNLDHGTDFQMRLDGMPLNMPTHAHGQGYTDLNFIIPELVEYLDYKLGVYHADVGDFGSAGESEFHLAKRIQPFATAGTGAYGLARVAAGTSTRIGLGELLLGGEVKTYNGPWKRAEDVRKLSGTARYSWNIGSSSFSLLGLAYHNRWNSSDQIPERAVLDGALSSFGQIDSTDGGHTQRYSLSGSWHHIGVQSAQHVDVYGIYSDLDLFSDFGFFLTDPIHGDQFNQVEHRSVVGLNASNALSLNGLGASHTVTFGVQSRADIVGGLGLFHTEAQSRIGTVRDDRVRETASGFYMEAESHWRPWFRTVLGARADGYTFDVNSDRAVNSGTRTAGILSPKASIVFAPTSETEIYLSGGYGFHSNDARGTTITVDPASGDAADRVSPLVRSRGAEVGMRMSPLNGWRSTLSVWALNLDSELLFTGDGGTTEPSAASRRSGVTFANFYRPLPSLSLDGDISFAHARFTGVDPSDVHIPGALESVFASGIAWEPLRAGLFGALRVRSFGAYPLIEDNSVRAKPSTLVNVDAGYRLTSGTRLRFSILNLMDARVDDIQYYYASRLRGEPVDGVNDVHFHPAEPRQVRAAVEWRFK
jgi:hypothetical protein